MKRIYKYHLSIVDTQTVTLPSGYKILSLQTQHGDPVIWAIVDESNPVEEITIKILYTGADVCFQGEYIGTFQNARGALIFHAFIDHGEKN